jgi:hypothetical protein
VTLAAARALQIEVHRVQVHNPNEFASVFAAMARAGDQAVVVISNPLSGIHRNEVVKSAAQSGLPAIYELRMFATAGGLLSYGADLVQLAADASRYVDKVLRGASPADLPAQQPTKFELVINLKTGKDTWPRHPTKFARKCRRGHRVAAASVYGPCCKCSGLEVARCRSGGVSALTVGIEGPADQD